MSKNSTVNTDKSRTPTRHASPSNQNNNSSFMTGKVTNASSSNNVNQNISA